MTKMKFVGGVLLVLAVLFAQVGSVAAAPQTQDGTLTISGTVTEIGQPETDENGVTTVLVTIETAEGPQTVRVSEEVAAGLVVGEPAEVVVNPEDVIPPEEEDVHPIADILGEFFDVDPSIVDGYHEDGFGFGVIAQAMWMSKSLGEDASVAGLILEAKKSGDYSAFTLPDGSTPTNWGQFKKALRDKNEKHNLGVIVSGHADKDDDDSLNPQNKEKKEKKEKKPKKEK